jgi:hypothetical protein
MVLMNLVTRRLIHGLIFFPSIPSMIACPANVPVLLLKDHQNLG